jgi:acetyl esterase/lipase
MRSDITTRPAIPADQRVAYGPDSNQFFDIWQGGSTAQGLAMMIHGGFWRAQYDLAHTSHLCAALSREGIIAASLEYRRVGNPGGGWPGTFEDVMSGVQAITSHFGKVPVAIGHSAGGHLALRLGAEPGAVKGVLALAPVAVLRLAYETQISRGAVTDFLGGTPADSPAIYEAACPSRHPAGVPRVLLNGTADAYVPLSMCEAFVEARRDDRPAAELIVLQDADHFDPIDPESPVWLTIVANVVKLLH